MENAVIAAKAIASYDRALRQNLSNYYNGINVVTLQTLLDFLAEKIGSFPAETGVTDLSELISVVSVATRQALKNPNEVAWAAPTLGELELVRGNGPAALRRYQQAANAPGVPYFEIDSMLGQLRLFEGLGFRTEAVAPVIKLLEKTHPAWQPAAQLWKGGRMQRAHDRRPYTREATLSREQRKRVTREDRRATRHLGRRQG